MGNDIKELIKRARELEVTESRPPSLREQSDSVQLGDKVYKLVYLGPEDEEARKFRALDSKEGIEKFISEDSKTLNFLSIFIEEIPGIDEIDALLALRDGLTASLSNSTQVEMFMREHMAFPDKIKDAIRYKNLRKLITDWKAAKMKFLNVRKNEGVITIQDVVSQFAARINRVNAEASARAEKARLEYVALCAQINHEKQLELNKMGRSHSFMIMTKPFTAQQDFVKKAAKDAFDEAYKKDRTIKFDEFVHNWWEIHRPQFMLQELKKVLEDPTSQSFLLSSSPQSNPQC